MPKTAGALCSISRSGDGYILSLLKFLVSLHAQGIYYMQIDIRCKENRVFPQHAPICTYLCLGQGNCRHYITVCPERWRQGGGSPEITKNRRRRIAEIFVK